MTTKIGSGLSPDQAFMIIALENDHETFEYERDDLEHTLGVTISWTYRSRRRIFFLVSVPSSMDFASTIAQISERTYVMQIRPQIGFKTA
jgi:hypothetical protein